MSGPIERDPLAWSEPETDDRHFVAVKVSTEGRCSLAHPLAEVGETLLGSVVWRVLEVPPEVTPLEVLELFGSCVIWRPGGPYIVRYAELRPGGLVR